MKSFSWATGAVAAVNLANLDDISYVISAGVTTGGLTITNMAGNGTLELTGAVGVASSVTVKDAATTTNDRFNIALRLIILQK